MKLNYVFNKQSDAHALYKGLFNFFTDNANAPTNEGANQTLEAIITKHHLVEARELYYLVSTYATDTQWITYVDFDDEAGKVADRLHQVFTEYCTELGITIEASKNECETDTDIAKLDWSNIPSTERAELANTGGIEQTFVFGLPATDSDYRYQSLTKSQKLACVEYWINQADIACHEIHMGVYNLSCDGEEIAHDLEHIRTRIFGYGGVELYKITLVGKDAKTAKHTLLAGEIESIAGNVLGYEQLVNSSYAGCQNRVELVSDFGVAVIFSCKRALSTAEKEQIATALQHSFIGKFVTEMYANVTNAKAMVFYKPDSDADEFDDFEDSIQEAEEEQTLYSLTELLKSANVGLSAVKANKRLIEKGVLQELKKRGSKSTKKIFADTASPYGLNVRKSDRKNDIEARYYKEPFQHLVDSYLT